MSTFGDTSSTGGTPRSFVILLSATIVSFLTVFFTWASVSITGSITTSGSVNGTSSWEGKLVILLSIISGVCAVVGLQRDDRSFRLASSWCSLTMVVVSVIAVFDVLGSTTNSVSAGGMTLHASESIGFGLVLTVIASIVAATFAVRRVNNPQD